MTWLFLDLFTVNIHGVQSDPENELPSFGSGWKARAEALSHTQAWPVLNIIVRIDRLIESLWLSSSVRLLYLKSKPQNTADPFPQVRSSSLLLIVR